MIVTVQNGLLRLDETSTQSNNSQVLMAAAVGVSSQSTDTTESSTAVAAVTSIRNTQLCQDHRNCSCELTT